MVRNLFVTFLVTLLLLSNICVSYAAIHHQMTKDELKSTFHVDNHKLVPEYEIVDIHHVKENEMKFGKLINPLNSYSNKEINLKAFGKEINLTLKLNDGLINKNIFKMWTAELNATAENGIQYVDETPKINFEEFGELYQDEVNQAAILLKNHKNFLTVEGSIGLGLEISPIPERLLEKTAVDDNILLPQKHIVYKTVEDHSMYGLKYDYVKMEQDDYLNLYQKNANLRGKRATPTQIYPEIKLIIDTDLYKSQNNNERQLFSYLAKFWNKVDLLYRLVKQPRIRLSIVEVIKSTDMNTLPYLRKNLMNKNNGRAIESLQTLKDVGKYLYEKDNAKKVSVLPYDVALITTKSMLFNCPQPSGECYSVLGVANMKSACSIYAFYGQVWSVGIFRDSGDFNSILTAAHELGHMLGVQHDGEEGAEQCKSGDKYIMYYSNDPKVKNEWSSCSLRAFKKFSESETAKCLQNVPRKKLF